MDNKTYHCAKVTNNVDDEEDGAFVTLHCEVAAIFVARDGMPLGSIDEELPDLARGAGNFVRGVCAERKYENDDQDDHGVWESLLGVVHGSQRDVTYGHSPSRMSP
jgi:hypothetical protein